jgi:hypothetical protein
MTLGENCAFAHKHTSGEGICVPSHIYSVRVRKMVQQSPHIEEDVLAS